MGASPLRRGLLASRMFENRKAYGAAEAAPFQSKCKLQIKCELTSTGLLVRSYTKPQCLSPTSTSICLRN
jgi:hypothetical protein